MQDINTEIYLKNRKMEYGRNRHRNISKEKKLN